jgi:hypothetical protein
MLSVSYQKHEHYRTKGGWRQCFRSIKEGAERAKKTGVFCRAFW